MAAFNLEAGPQAQPLTLLMGPQLRRISRDREVGEGTHTGGLACLVRPKGVWKSCEGSPLVPLRGGVEMDLGTEENSGRAAEDSEGEWRACRNGAGIAPVLVSGWADGKQPDYCVVHGGGN